jgi:iron-sulfur cluster assembly accessory protein
MTATSTNPAGTANPGAASGLTITDAALAKIREVMSQQQLQADEKNLRVFVDGGGGCCGGGPSFGLAFDRAQEGDAQFQQSGMTVIVDPMSLPYCAGATVDYVDSAEVQGFKVTAPAMQALREQSGGGCGGGSCGSGGGGGGCGGGSCGSESGAAHGGHAHEGHGGHAHEGHGQKASHGGGGGGCCGSGGGH